MDTDSYPIPLQGRIKKSSIPRVRPSYLLPCSQAFPQYSFFFFHCVSIQDFSRWTKTTRKGHSRLIVLATNVLVMCGIVFSMTVSGCLHTVSSDRIADFTALDSFLRCEEDREQKVLRGSPDLGSPQTPTYWCSRQGFEYSSSSPRKYHVATR